VLALLTAFAAPRVDVTRYRSDAMGRQVASILSSAARLARERRIDVVVRIDSAGRRVGTHEDRNANGVTDPGEPLTWVALDPSTDILDPPRPLPLPRFQQARQAPRVAAPGGEHRIVFRKNGSAGDDFVMYLTTDLAQPSAWRGLSVTAHTGATQLWRYDGQRWTRGRS
jgi:hypothetical protein